MKIKIMTENDIEIIKTFCSEWINKGNIDENPFSKFLCYWTALSNYSACEYYYSGTNPGLTGMGSDNELNKRFNELRKDIQFAEKFINLVSIGHMKELRVYGRHEGRTLYYDSSLEQTLWFLFGVRNNIFDGGISMLKDHGKKVINAAVPVLEEIVKKVLVFEDYLDK